MAYAAKRPRGLDLALSVTAAAVPNDASRVFDSVIRSRGVVLDELAARRIASYSGTAENAGVTATAIAARQRFANLVVRSLVDVILCLARGREKTERGCGAAPRRTHR